MKSGFALFETVIGRCGIAWSGAGLSGLQLPESDEARERLEKAGIAVEEACTLVLLSTGQY